MSLWVFQFLSWCVRELLVFREFKSRCFDLSCTSCMRRMFILCWHHRENKRLLMYRNIKSQDDFIDNKTAVYNQHFKNHSVRLQIRTIGLLISTWVKIKEKAPLPTKGYGHAVGLSCMVKGKSVVKTWLVATQRSQRACAFNAQYLASYFFFSSGTRYQSPVSFTSLRAKASG